MRQEEKTAEPVAGAGDRGKEKNVWWIWWRRVEDWASLLESWVCIFFITRFGLRGGKGRELGI